jgi:hypothetical protein
LKQSNNEANNEARVAEETTEAIEKSEKVKNMDGSISLRKTNKQFTESELSTRQDQKSSIV